MSFPVSAGVSPFFRPLPVNTLGSQPSCWVPTIAANCSTAEPLARVVVAVMEGDVAGDVEIGLALVLALALGSCVDGLQAESAAIATHTMGRPRRDICDLEKCMILIPEVSEVSFIGRHSYIAGS